MCAWWWFSSMRLGFGVEVTSGFWFGVWFGIWFFWSFGVWCSVGSEVNYLVVMNHLMKVMKGMKLRPIIQLMY